MLFDCWLGTAVEEVTSSVLLEYLVRTGISVLPLDTQHSALRGLVPPEDILLQISPTLSLCTDNVATELRWDAALTHLLIDADSLSCIIIPRDLFLSSAFSCLSEILDKERRSKGTSATETTHYFRLTNNNSNLEEK
jgi:hypothetical protein